MLNVCSRCKTPLDGAEVCPKCGKRAKETDTSTLKEISSKHTLDYKLISVIAFFVGIVFMGIGGIIQFISAMGSIGKFNDMLRLTGSSGFWILLFLIISMLGMGATVFVVWKRLNKKKHNIGIISSVVLFLVLFIFHVIGETALELGGFVLFCKYSVTNVVMFVFYILSVAAFIGSKSMIKMKS